MKKILGIALAGVMMLSMAACGSKEEAAPAETAAHAAEEKAEETAETEEGAVYTVGICQLVEHEALDAATQGFKDALIEELGEENVVFDEQNAAGDSNTCSTIVNSFVSKDVDLILANATPALQAAAASTTEIPILGTSVTEYGVALGIDNFDGTVGGNISGTSDLPPLDQQAEMVVELFPDAQKVGLIYCSAEANSQYQVDNVKAELEAKGLEATLYSFADSNDIASVVQTACDNSDVIYVPTDNTAASSASIIDGVCRPAGIPVIAGEEGICAACGVATLSISYYDLGFATGKMAAKILTGESNVAEMPIEYAPQFVKKYNAEIVEDLGVEIPDDYIAIE